MASTNTRTPRVAKAAAETADKAFAAGHDAAEAAFSYSSFEVPEFVRTFAEQGLTQTRDAYARMKSAAEEATDLLETSLDANREKAREVQVKALDIAKENADATFELMRSLLAATSVADAFQLQSTFARGRFEALIEYSRDMQTAIGQAGAEAGKPATAFFGRTINGAKAA